MSQLNSFYAVNQKVAKYLPLWTQGAGSNISYKLDDSVLVIKASGYRLDQITETDGYVFLDYPKLREKLHNLFQVEKSQQEISYSQAIAESKIPDTNSLRPSMESGFHAFSEKKWVVHFHSLASVLMAEVNNKRGAEFSLWISKNNLDKKINFIPLSKPGWELSTFFTENNNPINIIVNHGIILQSDDSKIVQEWEQIENLFLKDFGFDYLLGLNSRLQTLVTQEKSNFRSNIPSVMNHPLSAELLRGPIKFYFPDMAIYYSKLQPHLSVVNQNEFQLSENASEDLKEIWIATQILFRSCPDLQELPEKMVEDITQLPTEKLRVKFLK